MGLGETETPFVKAHTDFHMHWVPGQSKVSIGIWVRLTAVLGGPPGKTGGECVLLWGKGTGGKTLGNIHQHAFLWKWPFWENVAPPISAKKPQGKQQSGGAHNPTHQ